MQQTLGGLSSSYAGLLLRFALLACLYGKSLPFANWCTTAMDTFLPPATQKLPLFIAFSCSSELQKYAKTIILYMS